MPVLKNTQQQIPNGFRYYLPATKWEPAPFSSLDSITQQLISHLSGRPDVQAKMGWPLDRDFIYQRVLEYQVALCVQNKWNDYLLGGDEATVPFQEPTRRPLLARARAVVAGAETIVSWIDDGAPTVPQELANRRAERCVPCPKNGKGGFESYFTVPAANAIRKQIERKREMKMETPFDDKLGVCEACTCPLVLKPWMPLDRILAKMPPADQEALDPNCWIRKRDQ